MSDTGSGAVTLERLQAIAREVCGDPGLVLTPEGSARDVPGWDSLNHTLIILDVNAVFGIDLSPYETGQAETFGALLGMISEAVAKQTG